MKLRTWITAVAAFLGTSLLVVQAQSPTPGINSTLSTIFTYMYEPSTNKATYSAAMSVEPVASSPTDVCSLYGSATKRIRVRKLIVSGEATSVTTEPIAIMKRSTAASNGTSVATTGVAWDSTNATATALADIYSTNPTVGTLVGVIADPFVTWSNFTTGVGTTLTYNFGERESPVILRSASQGLTVHLNGITTAGLNLMCTWVWTEDSDS